MKSSSPPPTTSDKKSNQSDPREWTFKPQSMASWCWWIPSSSSSSHSQPFVFLVSLVTFSTSLISFTAASRSAPTPSSAVDHITDSSGLNVTILIAAATAAAALALFLMAWFKCFRFQKNRVVGNDVEGEVGSKSEEEEVGVRRFSWDEVMTLTNGLEKIIDSGGFSVVYYGTLPINPTSKKSGVGAFKVHNNSERLNQGFKEELSILLKLNHTNIVKLHGYCDDQERGALAFEYVQNGTLQENLHRSRAEENSLSWGIRVSIAYQLAIALEYLHEHCEMHVVHGDIKSSNILLDSNFNVKLCDFGSAKMGFSAGLAPSRKHLITGSPGYVDPHYLRTGISSKKNDIYSFGVVLMELLTGMEAFCNETGRMLTSRFESGSGRMCPDLVDPRLGGECELQEWLVVGEIAGMCLRGSPSLRPSASEVISMMRQNVRSMGV